MFRLKNEKGFSLVLVAIVLVVLIGMVAFAVDVGALYEERRELQNGADAAALAIAENCGRGLPCDTTTAEATADQYADANGIDGAAAIDELDLDLAAQTVRVETATETSDGGTIFRPFFAQVIGFEGSTVRAEASAAWGVPAGSGDIPLTISKCEWDKFVGPFVVGYRADGTPILDLNEPPAEDQNGDGVMDHLDWFHLYDPPGTNANSITATFHDGKATEDCSAEAGQDTDGDGRLSGGFGWLDTDGDCYAETDHEGWYGEDPGASPSSGCGPSQLQGILGTVVTIPVFTDTQGLGANGQYLMTEPLALYVTGYNFGGQYKEWLTDEPPCKGDVRCIQGYPTVTLDTTGDILPGGEYRGVLVVKLTG